MEEEMEDRKLRRSIGNQRSASEVLNAPFKVTCKITFGSWLLLVLDVLMDNTDHIN